MPQALMVIADIGGYTDYMRMHRLGLAHAQVNTARLLEAVIDAVPDLELIEIEGDAAFMSSAQVDDLAATTAEEAAVTMHRAFHTEQQRMVAANLCSCKGCVAVGRLRLKCVAHVGEVAEQRIRDRTKLVGVDVILVHRMLKNSVPVDEYLLLSEDLYGSCDSTIRDRASAVDDDLEGIGRVRAYFVDLDEVAEPLPPVRKPTIQTRVAETLRTIGGGAPYMMGLRKLHRH